MFHKYICKLINDYHENILLTFMNIINLTKILNKNIHFNIYEINLLYIFISQ
jgi:hypothetical protein